MLVVVNLKDGRGVAAPAAAIHLTTNPDENWARWLWVNGTAQGELTLEEYDRVFVLVRDSLE